MFRKMYEYQKLNSYMSGSMKKNSMLRIIIMMLIFMMVPILSIVLETEFSFPTYLFVLVMCLGAMQIRNSRNTLIRNLPFSDKFVVAGSMFVVWIYYYVMVGGVMLLMYFLGSALTAATSSNAVSVITSTASTIFGMGAWILGNDSRTTLLGIACSVIIMICIWFLFCIAMYTRNKIARVIMLVGIFGIYVAAILTVRYGARCKGFYGSIRISDIALVYPPFIVLGVVTTIAIVIGIVCWKYALKMLRYDVKGQQTSYVNETKSINEYNKFVEQTVANQASLKGRRVIVLIIILIAVVNFAILANNTGIVGQSDSVKDVDITMTGADSYNEWNEIGTSYIFPASVETENVVEYKARKYGAEDDGWETIVKYRYLCQKMTDDEYQAEKERVAGITVKSNSKYALKNENKVIHDTEHFKTEAYIAKYEPTNSEYEYALFDDAKKQVTYIYCYGEDYRKVFEGYDIFATGHVISIEQANTDNMEFAIDSFYDTDLGWYDTIDE